MSQHFPGQSRENKVPAVSSQVQKTVLVVSLTIKVVNHLKDKSNYSLLHYD